MTNRQKRQTDKMTNRQKDIMTKQQKDKMTKRLKYKQTKRQKGKRRVKYCDVRAVSHSCDVFFMVFNIQGGGTVCRLGQIPNFKCFLIV